MKSEPNTFQKAGVFLACFLAFLSLGLQVHHRMRFEAEVRKVVEEREKQATQELVNYLNKAREGVGQGAAYPTNFPGVMMSFFESLSGLYDFGISTND